MSFALFDAAMTKLSLHYNVICTLQMLLLANCLHTTMPFANFQCLLWLKLSLHYHVTSWF